MNPTTAATVIFGEGILGKSLTGLVRIPAFMASALGAVALGELCLRGIVNTLNQCGLKASDKSWLQHSAACIEEKGARPYKNTETKQLLIQAVAFCAIGIVGGEFARILGGQTPSIYNTVLSFIGPLRISSDSYVTTCQNAFASGRELMGI